MFELKLDFIFTRSFFYSPCINQLQTHSRACGDRLWRIAGHPATVFTIGFYLKFREIAGVENRVIEKTQRWGMGTGKIIYSFYAEYAYRARQG